MSDINLKATLVQAMVIEIGKGEKQNLVEFICSSFSVTLSWLLAASISASTPWRWRRRGEDMEKWRGLKTWRQLMLACMAACIFIHIWFDKTKTEKSGPLSKNKCKRKHMETHLRLTDINIYSPEAKFSIDSDTTVFMVQYILENIKCY